MSDHEEDDNRFDDDDEEDDSGDEREIFDEEIDEEYAQTLVTSRIPIPRIRLEASGAATRMMVFITCSFFYVIRKKWVMKKEKV
jgi:hypothetical protein